MFEIGIVCAKIMKKMEQVTVGRERSGFITESNGLQASYTLKMELLSSIFAFSFFLFLFLSGG